MSKDYYDILGVSKNASAEELKTAFRKKAHEHHPDKGGDAERFKEINEAYQVLGNAEKRQKYDQFGSAAFNQGGFSGAGAGGFGGFDFSGFQGGGIDMEDLFGGFGDIFGFGAGRQSARHSTRGQDLEVRLNLGFMEAAFGTEKEISLHKQVVCGHCHGQGGEPGAKLETCATCGGKGKITRVQRTILGNIQTQAPCPDCDGAGKKYSRSCSQCGGDGIRREAVRLKVKIPAGINDGESIRLSGQGEAGAKGASAGDLYLRISLQSHKKFMREGYDIRTEETISISQAILGAKIEVQTIHGELMLKIPEGTQSGTVFKLKEKGVPNLHGRGTGDQYVKITVKIPTGLNRRQKQLLNELDI